MRSLVFITVMMITLIIIITSTVGCTTQKEGVQECPGVDYTCEQLDQIPCEFSDTLDPSWPCGCVGPGLEAIEEDVPPGPPPFLHPDFPKEDEEVS